MDGVVDDPSTDLRCLTPLAPYAGSPERSAPALYPQPAKRSTMLSQIVDTDVTDAGEGIAFEVGDGRVIHSARLWFS